MAPTKQTTLDHMFGKRGVVSKVISKTEREGASIKPALHALSVLSSEQVQAELKEALTTSTAPQRQELKFLMKDPRWRTLLDDQFRQPYFKQIGQFLENEEKEKHKAYPPRQLIFNAFNLTSLNNIRVVILGQDPYHGEGEAHGLCFSVPPNVLRLPPSLQNIFKELEQEFSDFKRPTHGCLEGWAKQGVFLLNATLTVRAREANSHANVGWQTFTDQVIRVISKHSKQGIVFLLWGQFAQRKAALIDQKKHVIIKSAHPSPFSYHMFKGCRCFTQANEALTKLGRKPIDWGAL